MRDGHGAHGVTRPTCVLGIGATRCVVAGPSRTCLSLASMGEGGIVRSYQTFAVIAGGWAAIGGNRPGGKFWSGGAVLGRKVKCRMFSLQIELALLVITLAKRGFLHRVGGSNRT